MTELEKAAEKYGDKVYLDHGRCNPYLSGCCFSEHSYEVAFIAGAQWQAERAQELVEALKFYASPHNHITPSGKIGVTDYWVTDCEPMDGFVYHVAGKRARQALAKWRGEG